MTFLLVPDHLRSDILFQLDAHDTDRADTLAHVLRDELETIDLPEIHVFYSPTHDTEIVMVGESEEDALERLKDEWKGYADAEWE